MNEQLIGEIKKKALEEKVPIMEDEGLEYVCHFLHDNNVKSLLEIGTAVGYSSIVFASTNPDLNITTIEINEDRYKQAVENIRRVNLEGRIKVHLADAREYTVDGEFDVLFLDGPKAHNQELLENYSRNLKPNGIIIVDDVYFHGFIDNPQTMTGKRLVPLVNKFRKFRDNMLDSDEYDSEYLKIGDGVLICRRKQR